MSPVIRISPTCLRVVRKRIGLTAQTAGCLPLKSPHTSGGYCLFCFFIFLNFLRQEHSKHTFSWLFFYQIQSCPLQFLKEIHSRAAQKQDLFNIQIKIHLSQFISALQTNHQL